MEVSAEDHITLERLYTLQKNGKLPSKLKRFSENLYTKIGRTYLYEFIQLQFTLHKIYMHIPCTLERTKL